jgi:hypothetical protein
MIGKALVYETITDKLGSQADAWLDAPIAELAVADGATQIDAQSPREALESGCPACIDGVYQMAKKL